MSASAIHSSPVNRRAQHGNAYRRVIWECINSCEPVYALLLSAANIHWSNGEIQSDRLTRPECACIFPSVSGIWYSLPYSLSWRWMQFGRHRFLPSNLQSVSIVFWLLFFIVVRESKATKQKTAWQLSQFQILTVRVVKILVEKTKEPIVMSVRRRRKEWSALDCQYL